MPIRRPSDNDPDWMAKKQDKELIYLEQRISALYEEASTELSNEYERFYSSYQLEYERRLAMVESGELSQDSFEVWCRNQIFQSNRYQAMIRMLTDVLVNADVAAMAAVNEQLPFTLAESYDFIASLGFEAADRAGISMGTFQIYNADSVREIIRQNPNLFPVVDLPEDEAWNRRHINNEIMQAIIQGDSMQQVARRLQNVAAMDDRAAIRNARTAMTAAENLGRSECATRLRGRGIPVREQWLATKDSHTRDTHLLLDGTFKDENGFYGADILRVPLRFPSDPNGEPQEVYNCRCRDNVVLEGIDHSNDFERYQSFMQENYPEDYAQLESRYEENGKADERRQALERQRRLRETYIQKSIQESHEWLDILKNQESPDDWEYSDRRWNEWRWTLPSNHPDYVEGEYEAVRRYSGGGYTDVNNYLRGNPYSENWLFSTPQEDAQMIHNAIARSNLPQDVVTIRKADANNVEAILGSNALSAIREGRGQDFIGSVVTEGGFYSSSMSASTAFGSPYRNREVEIISLLPEGTQAIYISNLTARYSGEHEILTIDNSNFVIRNIEYSENGFTDISNRESGTRIRIYMELIR